MAICSLVCATLRHMSIVAAFIGYVGRLPQEIDEILREMTRYLEERGGNQTRRFSGVDERSGMVGG